MTYTTHDELVEAIAALARTLDRRRFVDAFVASLSTRDLVWRDALGCHAILQNFAEHEHATYRHGRDGCSVCGLPATLAQPASLDPSDAPSTPATRSARELLRLGDAQPPTPTDADRVILRGIFDALRALPHSAGLSELPRSIMGLFKSNKNERTSLLETLGYIGVLCPTGAHDYTEAFVPFSESEWVYPPGTKSDWRYPARMWRGTEGIVEERVELYFAEYL